MVPPKNSHLWERPLLVGFQNMLKWARSVCQVQPSSGIAQANNEATPFFPQAVRREALEPPKQEGSLRTILRTPSKPGEGSKTHPGGEGRGA